MYKICYVSFMVTTKQEAIIVEQNIKVKQSLIPQKITNLQRYTEKSCGGSNGNRKNKDGISKPLITNDNVKCNELKSPNKRLSDWMDNKSRPKCIQYTRNSLKP